MLYYPYLPEYDMYRKENSMSYIRLLHASPGSPPVDVYANKKLIAKKLSYKNFTEYLSTPAGYYNIQVFASGDKTSPLIDINLYIPAKSIYTIAAYNRLRNIKLLPIKEPLVSPIPSKALLRVVHLSPNTPNLNIALPTGRVLFEDVGYTAVTKYVSLLPGTYTVNAFLTDEFKKVLTVPNVRLKGNKIYTIYVVGLLDGNPPLQVLIALDGRSYIKF